MYSVQCHFLVCFSVIAPSIFPLCYNIVKHVLDERMRKKVTVLGYSQSELWIRIVVYTAWLHTCDPVCENSPNCR